MRAVRFHRFGDPGVLRVEEAERPRPGTGEVVVRTQAVGVGYAQTQMRRDCFPAPMWTPRFPVIPGGEVIGTVSEVGEGVTEVAVGDRVGAYVLDGACAEYVAVDAARLLPVPADLTVAEAMALPLSGPIAGGTIALAALRPGESVLVHAAAGGIGHLSVQLARRAGAGLVLATAGGADKCAFVRGLGADVVIDHTARSWPQEVRRVTGGKGVDVILDGVGGAGLEAGVDVLAPFGRLVFYGSAGGGDTVPSVSFMRLIGLRSVAGFTLSGWRSARPKRYLEEHQELIGALRERDVHHEIAASAGFERAPWAHELVESRARAGRVILVP